MDVVHMKAINTARLAQEAITRSIRKGISRTEALKEILRNIRVERYEWMTRNTVRHQRKVLFACVLSLIPHFEPNRFNARYLGIRKPNLNRLQRLAEKEAQKEENLPLLKNPPKKLQW